MFIIRPEQNIFFPQAGFQGWKMTEKSNIFLANKNPLMFLIHGIHFYKNGFIADRDEEFFIFCQNPNSTQPNITLVGLDMKMTLHTTLPAPPPPTETQCQQYLSCYWPDFDETLNEGSWEHLGQIPTVTATFVQTTFVQATFVQVTLVHIRNISAVTDPILT